MRKRLLRIMFHSITDAITSNIKVFNLCAHTHTRSVHQIREHERDKPRKV